MNILRPQLEFAGLTQRDVTDMIVIHHTGENDIDASAEQIHEWHLNQGWAGIGYHFVIRKNGDVEIGRPEWAVGSHACAAERVSGIVHKMIFVAQAVIATRVDDGKV